MKTILVTGGAGYIGSIAVRRLLEEKYNVIVLDNLSRGHRESLPQEVKLVKISISDEQKVLDFLGENKIDAVIHFAAYAYVGESVTDPNLYYNNNLVQGLIFLECLKKKNIKNIIFSSSCATYGIGEDHRPETHIIPNALQVALGKKDHFDLFGTDYETSDGTCIRDYVHVLDLIEAHILALKHLENGGESKFYNLAIGKGYSNKEILKTCEEVTGKKILVIERERRMGDPPILYASAEKIKEELGWEPKYELKDMVQSAWDWHKKNSEGYH